MSLTLNIPLSMGLEDIYAAFIKRDTFCIVVCLLIKPGKQQYVFINILCYMCPDMRESLRMPTMCNSAHVTIFVLLVTFPYYLSIFKLHSSGLHNPPRRKITAPNLRSLLASVHV